MAAFDELATNLRIGWDDAAQPAQRAAALFQAALITRTNGMELLGTEVAPDWHYHLGQFEEGVTGEDRSSNSLAIVVPPSDDEIRRNAEHFPDPNVRFHYRYQAASLAWEAAKLLPDNDDLTAYILWQGGSFIKNRDPLYADVFYKALVRKNRQTVLGAEADRQRWFPIIDVNGNILPRRSRTEVPKEQLETQAMEEPNNNEPSESDAENLPTLPGQSEAIKGYEYTIQKGDSLASLAQAFTKAGVMISSQELLAANPGLDPAKLRVGQVIFVPVSEH